jgi:hypothetical protein
MKVSGKVLREMLCFDVPTYGHLVNIVPEMVMVAVGFNLRYPALWHLCTDELYGLRQLLELVIG